ncbi:MAG: glucodextranase DOMON-like domain-containing protein, partial [Myxococcota bacterium]
DFGRGLLFLAALGVLFPLWPRSAAFAAPPQGLLDLADDRNDDKGPGSYVYPSEQNYRPGQFDLRRFQIRQDGTNLIFAVELDSSLRKPDIARFSDAVEIRLENGVYVQNIDICIDNIKGQGEVRSIPGRRVRFKRSEGWDVCVVITPLPYRARSMLSGWKSNGRVIVPVGVRSHDSWVEARVPIVDLGGPYDPSWGFQVLISGSQWQISFDAVNRLMGSHVTNVFTMPVTTVAEQLAFGGGELSNFHPWVIDILTPPLSSQTRALRSFDGERRSFATVPMVYPNPVAHQSAVKRAQPAPGTAQENTSVLPDSDEFVYGTIKDVSGDLIVLSIDPESVAAFRLGDVLDEEGQVVAHVVTSQIHKSFVVATPVDGRKQIRPDLKVRFRRPKEE